MKAAILINFKWITSNTVDNPFKDVSVFALNGIRIGKLKIFNDDREFCEIKDDLIEEFEAENPDFLAKQSIIILKDSVTDIIRIMDTLPVSYEDIRSRSQCK